LEKNLYYNKHILEIHKDGMKLAIEAINYNQSLSKFRETENLVEIGIDA